ncbi:polysaccharide deacetylase family protein [Propioniciclava sp. MC1595]|nr:polysaccharide deacetylase family protein [Propioniciclava sp. MC1595]
MAAPVSHARTLGRRGLLLGAAAAVGAGCARPPAAEPSDLATTGSAASTPAATPSTAPTPAPSPSASPSPTAGPATASRTLPSRAEIVSRYAGRAASEWGWEVDGVVNRLGDQNSPAPDADGVALTLDACGGGTAGSGYDEALIETLRRHEVAATLYLNARWIAANPALAAELAADPLFVLASHGTRHVPLSVAGRSAYGIAGTADVGEVYDEVTAGFDWFVENTGALPATMRPGTAHCDEVAAAIAIDLGAPIAGLSVNLDDGATLGPAGVAQRLARARAGDIVLGHFNRPAGGTAEGVAQALPRLLDAGTRFVGLGTRGPKAP